MSADLTSQKCEACTIDAPRVTEKESEELIKTLDNRSRFFISSLSYSCSFLITNNWI